MRVLLWAGGLCLLALALLSARLIETRGEYLGPTHKVIAEPPETANDWQPVKVASDSVHVIKVMWCMDDTTMHETYCKAVFANEKLCCYKLVAPWRKDMVLHWQEIKNPTFTIVPALLNRITNR